MANQSYSSAGLFGQPSFGDYSGLSGGVPVQITPQQIQQQLAKQQNQYGGDPKYYDLYNSLESSGFNANVNTRPTYAGNVPINSYINPMPFSSVSDAVNMSQQQATPVSLMTTVDSMDVGNDQGNTSSNVASSQETTLPVNTGYSSPRLVSDSPIVSGVFPEVDAMQRALYQQKQNEAMQAQAMRYASLDPMQQAQYSLYLGGQQLGGAIGGALGAKDPQLQMIAQRQQMLSMVDPNKPETYGRAIQFALQTGDRNTALMLNDEMKNAQARKTQALDTYAQQLLPTLKNADGTINEQVKSQLLAFPQGRAAITELAKTYPSLRTIGAAGGQEEDPFAVFTQDPNTPANVKTVAARYSTSLKNGTLNPEDVDKRVTELGNMTQRAQQFEQNQAQIVAQQQVLNSLKTQGLENSTQALAIQRSLLALQQQNATFNQQTKLAEIDRKKEEAANKPLRPDLAKDEEADYAKASEARNLAIEANDYVSSIKRGDIKFGLKDRASIAARSALGSNDPDVVARNDFERFKTRLVNESLRLNKGTQTEGDAQRSIKELQGAESAVDAAKAINTLAEINARKVSDAKVSIERRRINANIKLPEVPIETLKFEPHTFTQQEVDAFLKNPKYPSGTIFVDPDGKRKVKP